eukprot:scaffold2630_cov82-Amphora_coffeaeformis.AAC.4
MGLPTHTSHHKKRICPEHQLRKTDDGVQELSRSDSNCFKTIIDQIVVAVKSFWPLFDSKSVFLPRKGVATRRTRHFFSPSPSRKTVGCSSELSFFLFLFQVKAEMHCPPDSAHAVQFMTLTFVC